MAMAFQMKTLVKMAVLCMLGLAMVGCSSTGRFMNDEMTTENVLQELNSYTPSWNPTGDADMDRVGMIAVMAIEDKKPAMDAMFAQMWAAPDLTSWSDSARADLKEQGISWGDADEEQRHAAMTVAWGYLDEEQQTGIRDFYEKNARQMKAANDDAAETLQILNSALKTADRVVARVSQASESIDGLVGAVMGAGKIVDGVDQVTEMVQWGNATEKYMSTFADWEGTWDQIFKDNDRKAME
jgi:hypothetical protein